MNVNVTKTLYTDLAKVYDALNKELFGGQLPHCLITMQRKNKAFGYYSKGRFGSRDGQTILDEIALNPMYFEQRTDDQIISTLLHEMVHLWQLHFGKNAPNRPYHNREWADKMLEVGLQPSNTGKPGGKETGAQMTHYIVKDGRFHRWLATAKLGTLYHDRRDEEVAKVKKASKTKYTCTCCGLNVWGKPEIKIVCYECDELMETDA